MNDFERYLDLLIEGDDIQLPEINTGDFVEDRQCIAQDLIHALRESGYLERLVAERSEPLREFLLGDIRNLIESDPRIEPGSVSMDWNKGKLWIAAQSEFGVIRSSVEVVV